VTLTQERLDLFRKRDACECENWIDCQGAVIRLLLDDIERLQAENAALRENESRLAFHVVPELEEQLRAADKLAADVAAECRDHKGWMWRACECARCVLLSAYFTARGKK
jgi:hypothetical protein